MGTGSNFTDLIVQGVLFDRRVAVVPHPICTPSLCCIAFLHLPARANRLRAFGTTQIIEGVSWAQP